MVGKAFAVQTITSMAWLRGTAVGTQELDLRDQKANNRSSYTVFRNWGICDSPALLLQPEIESFLRDVASRVKTALKVWIPFLKKSFLATLLGGWTERHTGRCSRSH